MFDRRFEQTFAGFNKTKTRVQKFLWRQLDFCNINFVAGARRFPAATHADDPDARHVSFQQRVRRLRRAVGDQHDFVGIDTAFLQKFI